VIIRCYSLLHETSSLQSFCQSLRKPASANPRSPILQVPCSVQLHIGQNATIWFKLSIKISNLPAAFLRGPLLPLIGCTFFAFAGLPFLRHLGVENDEALYGSALYEPHDASGYWYRIGHHRLPLMLMSYLGTLKAWIYQPLFKIFSTGILTIRLPALLTGVLSLWIFYLLLGRIAGRRAALIGCGLLASDAIYLLTTCFDWGPVALQHLLLLSGIFLLIRFWQQGHEFSLAAGFFLCGLALWDKALAVWILSGLAVAAAITLPQQILTRLTLRRLALAAVSLSAGAFPLTLYNIHSRGGTLHENASYEAQRLPQKVDVLVSTFRGSGLFGFLTAEDGQTAYPHTPSTWLERSSSSLAELAGHPHSNLFPYAFYAALALTIFARGRDLRAILFCLIAFLVAWIEMALTANAGGAIHHTILLWPLPQAIVAFSFAPASRRLARFGLPLLTAALLLLIGSGVLLVNEYYAKVVRNGGTVIWTDAVFPLNDYLKRSPAKYIYCLDWGFLDTLRLLGAGRLPLRYATVPSSLATPDRRLLAAQLEQPGAIFVNHTKSNEIYPDQTARLVQFAAACGYKREDLTVIFDSYGRAVFEIYRFAWANSKRSSTP